VNQTTKRASDAGTVVYAVSASMGFEESDGTGYYATKAEAMGAARAAAAENLSDVEVKKVVLAGTVNRKLACALLMRAGFARASHAVMTIKGRYRVDA